MPNICTIDPSVGTCTVGVDTSGAPPGTYHMIVRITNSLQQCDSPPIDVTLQLLPEDICTWITYKGEWTAITSYDVMTLVNAYLGIDPLGFTVTLSHIAGAISYYLGRLPSGNLFTGCNF